MAASSSAVAERSRIMWCMRLHSALRTAVPCTIIGCATIYGPKFLVNEIRFAAFSYLTAVLIVSDASLGDTLSGCWHAFIATAQVVPLAVLGRWLVDPTAGLPLGYAAVAVGVAAFMVAMPECTHLTAKRIAFGQIVLVCSDAVISRDGKGGAAVMNPVYVAASTALGASASVLALLIPYPSLACHKVQKLCRVYAENASQRMNIYLRAFSAGDNHTKTELISQTKPLAETGDKLLQSIIILQEGMKWERPWSRYLEPNKVSPGEILQNVELQMRGIEYSLASSPAQTIDQEHLSNILQDLSIQLEKRIEQLTCSSPYNSSKESETRGESKEKLSLPLDAMSPILEHGWVFFYFSCIDMLLSNSSVISPKYLQTQPAKTESFSILTKLRNWISKIIKNGRLEFAFKCSLSLSLAVLFGLIFDKENGCWAGLTIAISFVTGRQAIFTVANTRGQGTAIGSVYGVVCCFLFHSEEVRLIALLPWIVFTCFLRYSKLYGQTGGVSAAIGALLIVGRKNYGVPNEFAIARLTEVFIGLSAFILVELFLQPIRAATLAKNHLCTTLNSLEDCVKEIGFFPVQKNQFLELREKQRNLSSLVCELKKFVADAEVEPDFWYLPFRASSYQKLVGSLSNIVHMLYFITYNFEILLELSETSNMCKEFQEQMNNELELFQETLSSLQVYLEKALSTESQADSHASVDDKFRDLEMGKRQNPEKLSVTIDAEHKAADRSSHEQVDSEELRERMIRCLGATGFCISSLMKEIDDTEMCIREIDQWES